RVMASILFYRRGWDHDGSCPRDHLRPHDDGRSTTSGSGGEVLRRPLLPLDPDLLRREELLHRKVQVLRRRPESLADGLHPLPGVALDEVVELVHELRELSRRALLAGGPLRAGGLLRDRGLGRGGAL